MAKIPDTRFRLEPHLYETADGKKYIFDAALVPALRHVPPAMLLSLLEPLARDYRAQYQKWYYTQKRVRDRRNRWIEEAIRLHNKGISNRSIGARLAGKENGTAATIARTLGWYIRTKK